MDFGDVIKFLKADPTTKFMRVRYEVGVEAYMEDGKLYVRHYVNGEPGLTEELGNEWIDNALISEDYLADDWEDITPEPSLICEIPDDE